MEKIKLLTILLVELLMTQHVMAQTDPVFTLGKEGGHFYFETSVNGVPAKLMLESGVPGLMMGDAFYEAQKETLQLDVKECDEKIRYLGGIHKIKYTAQARLRMGEAIFEGPVKIVEGATDLKMPIQLLHHASDNSSIVKMDLQNNELCVMSRAHLQELVKDATALDMSYNKWGYPVVNTQLSMNVNDCPLKVNGNFVADMGNASLLFLNKSQDSVAKMLTESKVQLKEARDKKGNVVAEGLYAERLTICDRTYHNVSVGVNPFKSLEECGFLGLKFFTMPTVFDFDHQKMYLCK